jgi:hypothetical protein
MAQACPACSGLHGSPTTSTHAARKIGSCSCCGCLSAGMAERGALHLRCNLFSGCCARPNPIFMCKVSGAAQPAPRPNNSWLPCPRLHPSLRSLSLLSFSSPLSSLSLYLVSPTFSVATPSFCITFLFSFIEVLLLSESLSHGALAFLLSLLSPLPTV